MQLNQSVSYRAVTHGGAPAVPHLTPLQELRRTTLSCLLWEDGFYESGQSIGDRITSLVEKVAPADVAALAIECRQQQNLRHVPLLLCAALARTASGTGILAKTLPQVIRRADELSEFITIYWRNGKTPLSKQVKRGLAEAFKRFDAYQLAKHDRAKAIRLRDVLFLVHAKPKDDAQAAIWKQLVDGTLPSPDTWEVSLSGGADKRETFERLISENQLGYIALLRNLRGMLEAGVDGGLIRDAILARKGADKVLPFRYVAAARACPQMEPALDQALVAAVAGLPALTGKTAVLVDVSGSMDAQLSSRSDLRRIDAAAALASVINGDVRMFSFSCNVVEVPPRRGMAGVDALVRSQPHGGTALAEAVAAVNQQVQHDRLIVITDEQATTGGVPAPVAKHAYMINVASNKNGVGYGKWTHIDGFSERVLNFISEKEAA